MAMPETVYLSYDTSFGRDVTVGPHTVFLTDVTVEDDVDIRAFCHLKGAVLRSGARVGPYGAAPAGRRCRAGARGSAISSK